MTRAIPRLNDDLGFESIKQRITEMIHEIKQETESSLNEDEKLEVAREMMGHFTAEELAEGADVSSEKTHDKLNYWLAIGAIEAGTTTEQGYVVYRIVPELT